MHIKRKLIKQGGGGGLTVYLPKKWIDAQGLKGGDEVDFTPQDNKMIISGAGEGGVRKKVIEINSFNRHHVRSLVSSTYKAGYDEIVLNFKEAPKITEINGIVNSFTGLEVVSQHKNTFTIKSFLMTGESEVESLIVKMFQITKLIAETLDEEWNSVDVKNIQSLAKLNQMKLRDHCLRAIHSNRYGGDKSYDYYDLVTIIEKMSGQLYYLSRLVSLNKPKKTKILSKIILFLDEFQSCYLKKDFAYANRLWVKLHKELRGSLDENNILQTTKKEDPGVMAHHFYLFMLLGHMSSRLAALCA